MNNNIIIHNFNEKLDSVKIEYYNLADGNRVVSQNFRKAAGLPPSTQPAIPNLNPGSGPSTSFPQIAIQGHEDVKMKTEEVYLVNGSWDTSDKIPNLIAEMHVNTKDIGGFPTQNADLTDSPRDLTAPYNISYTVPSPRGSDDSGIESDCTEGNLSWLLNYKIQELPPVPDVSAADNGNRNVQHLLHQSENSNDGSSFRSRIIKVPTAIKHCDFNKSQQVHSYRYNGLKKPPFTYTELIEYALTEQGELTVSGIYQWISDHFPFYKQNDDRWKNSVRHNLSINPHFRKGSKAVQGAGHLWTIAQRDEKKCSHIKQRINQFFQNSYVDYVKPQDNIENELQAATESILGEINGQSYSIDTSNTAPIEVEYINLEDPNNGLEDFLAPPVSKQDIVNECGLGNDIFITDINPTILGLNLVESEVMPDSYEDVFEYYAAKQ